MKTITQLFFYVAFLFALNCGAQVNIDFEGTVPGVYTTSNAVNGWTISSQTKTSCATSTVWAPGSPEFSVVSTPIFSFPFVGFVPSSPLGGNNVVILNNTTANSLVTRIAQTYSVGFSNQTVMFAYAGIWENGGHPCCEQAGLKVRAYDQYGNMITCPSYSLAGAGCQYVPSYSTTGLANWANWQGMYGFNFSAYVGTYVTIEATVNDCIHGDHYGTVLFDAKIVPPLPCVCGITGQPTNHSFCSGTSTAVLNAATGYTNILWTAPLAYPISVIQSTQASITLTNAVAGSVYTLTTISPQAFCINVETYTLTATNVSISGVWSTSTCANGTGGSATIIPIGSSTGYNYTWINSTNSVVSTASVVSNLAPGNYSVSITASGSASATCGTATSIAAIVSGTPQVQMKLRSYCGNEAYFCASGTNLRWYSGLNLIPPPIGSASCYTAVSPAPGGIYRVAFDGPVGCRDSIEYHLNPVPPGSLAVSNLQLNCLGAATGSAVISVTPAAGAPQGTNSFSVFSTAPAYSAGINPTASNSFTVTGLSGGSAYIANVYDGSCKYAVGFSVPGFVFDYSLSPASSTICQNANLFATVHFTSPSMGQQYSYAWSPSAFLGGGLGTSQNVALTPSTSVGSVATIVYTVVVTPTAVNCPLTKTLAITVAKLSSPTISPVSLLCFDPGSSFTVNTNPLGGIFSGNAAVSSGGVISPMLAAIGQNTFSYAHSVGTCIATSVGSFTVNSNPVVTISGDTLLCLRESTTLFAGGANTYTWSDNTNGSTLTAIPLATTAFTVNGTDVATGCTGTKTITISVFQYPTLTISGDSVLCEGETATFTAGGANSYTWSEGTFNQLLLVSPLANTTYTLEGTSTEGCTTMKTISVVVSPCTDIVENSVDGLLRIYPNPTNGKVLVDVPRHLQLTIFDNMGRVIFEKNLSEGTHSIDLKNYPNGVYILKASYQNQIRIFKLVKTD